MSVTINGIACEERVKNYAESAETGVGVSSRKGYLCNWTDRFTVAKGLLGYTQAAGKGGPVTITVGAAHPELQYCFVRSVEFEPHGKPTIGQHQTVWDKCTVWASYGPARNVQWGATGFGDGTHGFIYAQQKISTSSEYITVPGRRAKFNDASNETIKTEVGFKIGLAEIEITLNDIPYMPDQVVVSLGGKINNAAYLGFPAYQLAFNGVTTDETMSSTGVYTISATYSFTFRTQRWDYAYNGLLSRWSQVVMLDGSTPLIPSADFSAIIPSGYYY